MTHLAFATPRIICSLVLAQCLLAAGVTAQRSAIVEYPLAARRDSPAPAGLADPEVAPLQLRQVESEGGIRIECDLERGRMSLLLSHSESLVVNLGTDPAVIWPDLILPMRKINSLTFSVEIPTTWLERGVLAYIQTVSGGDEQRVRTSAVAPLQLCAPGQLCSAIISGFYEGPGVFRVSPLTFRARSTPPQSSGEIEVQVTVRSNDWDLSHQVTRQGLRGTEIFLVLKEPGPGEGQLDVVETHSVVVQLGSQKTGEIAIYIAKTEIRQAPPSTLHFQKMEQ